jgi:hypothetical protein
MAGPGRPWPLKFLRSSITVLNVKGRRMSGVGKTQLGALDIGHDIKTGREHGGVGLFENDGKSAIDPRE